MSEYPHTDWTDWHGIDMWVESDGDNIDLHGRDGIWLLNKDVVGMHMPPVDHHYDEPAILPGSRWRGMRAKAGEAVWPILIASDDGSVRQWLERESRWWRAIEPDKLIAWCVRNPVTGEIRRLRLRHQPDAGHGYSHDPAMHGMAVYAVTLVAERALWEGQPISATWRSDSKIDFFGGLPLSDPVTNRAHKGPPFYISKGSTLSSARFTNPGVVPEFPKMIFDGPFERGHFGNAGGWVQWPFGATPGQRLIIDTDPTVQTAMLGNIPAGSTSWTDIEGAVDWTAQLSMAEWRSIPPKQESEFFIELVGGGAAHVEITPRHYRALEINAGR